MHKNIMELSEKQKQIISGQLCPYCGKPPVKIKASELYTYNGDGEVMICKSCKAWVGCHKNGPNKGKPMGRLANQSLRKAKIAAHVEFDRLWNTKEERAVLYARLSEFLGLSLEYTHIGMFSEKTCLKVLDFAYQQGVKGLKFVVRDDFCPRYGTTKAGSNPCLMCPEFLYEGKEFIICDENMNYCKLKQK